MEEAQAWRVISVMKEAEVMEVGVVVVMKIVEGAVHQAHHSPGLQHHDR